MKNLLAVPLLALVFAGPAPAASPLVLSRATLRAEPDRDGLLARTYDGDLDLVWTIGGHPAVSAVLSITEQGQDTGFFGWVTLPPGVRPGPALQLDCGRGPELTVAVEEVPKRKTAVVPAFKDSSKLRAALAGGALDITLSPGIHWLDQMVSLPANTIIRADGPGVEVRRAYVSNYGTNWPMFYPAENCTFYGLTFTHDRPGCQVFLNLPPPAPPGRPQVICPGLVVADCTFRRCNFGNYFADAYVRDCDFYDAGVVVAPSGFYLRCRFYGKMQDPFQYWSMPGYAPAVIDCTFDGTTRGVVFNVSTDAADFLMVGTRLRGINAVSGGDELLLAENFGVVRRLLALHTDVRGCDGSFCQFDHSCDGVYVADYYQDGGTGFLLRGDVGNANITIRDFELTNGAGVWAGPLTSGLSLVDGQVWSWHPTRGSSHFPQPSPVALGRDTAVYADPANLRTNTLARVRIETFPGYTPSRGFSTK